MGSFRFNEYACQYRRNKKLGTERYFTIDNRDLNVTLIGMITLVLVWVGLSLSHPCRFDVLLFLCVLDREAGLQLYCVWLLFVVAALRLAAFVSLPVVVLTETPFSEMASRVGI